MTDQRVDLQRLMEAPWFVVERLVRWASRCSRGKPCGTATGREIWGGTEMTPKLRQRLLELRDGQFDGEIFVIHDIGEKLVCLFVPTSYRYAREEFEHAVGSTLRADASADWGEVQYPVLVTMCDADQHD